ncbi:15126_t:CDS:1 [Funneliformis geosporum]|nr:15126_t:CDS:1 [Funneliformis geosporum]
MKDLFSKSKKERCQFKSYYCVGCKQQKPCHTISQEYCCSCAYQIEQERAREYSSYQLVYQRKKQEKKDSIQQLQLLKDYPGCRSCSSKEIDAYNLYENNQLVCQPCLIRKEGRSSSPISLTEQQKWYKKHWKIDLGE